MRTTKTRRLLSGIAAITVATFAVSLASVPESLASWTDQEYVSGPTAVDDQIGTLACLETNTDSTALGRILSGNLVGIDLDTLAAVDGITTTNTGGTVAVQPGSSQAVNPPNGFANPLSIGVLQALQLNLTGLLQFPLNTPTGVYGQYAEAGPFGKSIGSSGAITNTGAIDLALIENPNGPPQFATVRLGSLLEQITGSTISNLVTDLTDVSLGVGALAAFADLDACAGAWSGSIYQALDREYQIAGLNAAITSPLVSGLGTAVTTALGGIKADVQVGLEDETGPLRLLLSTLSALGNLANVSISNLELQVDLGPVNTLLEAPIALGNGLGIIDLVAGTITVDLAQLLGPSYANSTGLNGLNPNTQLLLNEAALNHLLTETVVALTDWREEVTTAIDAAYQLVKVKLEISLQVKLVLVPLANVHISVNSIDNGTDPVSFTCKLVGLLDCPGTLTSPLNGLLGQILPAIVTSIVGTVAKTTSALTSTLVNLIGTTTGTTGLTGYLGRTLNTLFGEDAVLSLIVNAQNAPDPAEIIGSPPEPGWATTLSPPSQPGAWPITSGQYGVTALRLVTLGVVARGVALDLAHARVGENTIRP